MSCSEEHSQDPSAATWRKKSDLDTLMCAKSGGPLLGNDADNFQVGINLGDPIFRGVYHGKQAHDDDLDQVVQRALDVGCTKLMVTGSDLKESAHAIELAKQFRTLQQCCRSA
jgi:hypothetical protein